MVLNGVVAQTASVPPLTCRALQLYVSPVVLAAQVQLFFLLVILLLLLLQSLARAPVGRLSRSRTCFSPADRGVSAETVLLLIRLSRV